MVISERLELDSFDSPSYYAVESVRAERRLSDYKLGRWRQRRVPCFLRHGDGGLRHGETPVRAAQSRSGGKDHTNR